MVESQRQDLRNPFLTPVEATTLQMQESLQVSLCLRYIWNGAARMNDLIREKTHAISFYLHNYGFTALAFTFHFEGNLAFDRPLYSGKRIHNHTHRLSAFLFRLTSLNTTVGKKPRQQQLCGSLMASSVMEARAE